MRRNMPSLRVLPKTSIDTYATCNSMSRLPPRLFKFLVLLWALCAATAARAQDDLVSSGIEAFREACLMTDPRFEKIYQWAANKGLKSIEGDEPSLDGSIRPIARQDGWDRVAHWKVAASGLATVTLN